ncbi:MAG: hypothetical protein IJU90_06060 [Bacteroidales bacterium]|nr:hypothetical protein [Bacteroidales bacterium]
MNNNISIFKQVTLLAVFLLIGVSLSAQGYYYEDPKEGCDSVFWARTGKYYTETGTYYDTSDQIYVQSIRINRSVYDTIDTIGCDTLFYRGGKYYNDRFFFAYSSKTPQDCDSFVYLNLTIRHPNTGEQLSSACDRMVWGGKILTHDTVGALATFKNQWGCDSVVTLDLIVFESKFSDTVADVCDSILWYGTMYYGGNPTHVFPNATTRGYCDSTLTLHINLLHGTHIDTFANACDTFTWRGNGLNASTHIRTPYMQFVNTQGCDSSVHLYLTMHYSNTGDTVARSCDSVEWHGKSFNSNDTMPTFAYLNQYGCDSVVTMRIILRYSSQSHDTAAACGNLIWRYHQYFESGLFSDTIYNKVGCDSVIYLHLTINPLGEGGLTGMFEIGEDRYALFSQGNLQYMPSEKRWRFAEHQYDYIGAGNKYVSSSYSGWLDLFGWGTSGYHHPLDAANVAYQPYAIDNVTLDNEINSKGYGPSMNMTALDLTGMAANYDWGVRNAISNGGRAAGQWRTLTAEEWNHLVYYRPRAIFKRALATVYGISGAEKAYGVVLLPESWYLPDNCTFNPGTEQGYSTNIYSNVQWQSMQGAGAIFLPAAGCRYTDVVAGKDEFGYYWSSSHYDAESAYQMVVTSSAMLIQPEPRHIGRSVRLVQDINGIDLPCATYGDTTARVDSVFLWYGQEFTETGEYDYLLPEVNMAGCDSTVIIHLTVGPTEGIANVWPSNVQLFTRDNNIIVRGIQGLPVRLFDVQGRTIRPTTLSADNAVFSVPASGVYMIQVGRYPARKVSLLR